MGTFLFTIFKYLIQLEQHKFRVWLSAARPHTLPASVVPVFVGAALAINHQQFRWDTSVVALICAILIQIGTNFANDYYDFKNGADRKDRIGFVRATAAGLVSPASMKFATYLTMFLAFLVGLYLVWIGGWVILLIGILSLLFGIAYTGGPYPLGYNGLGDIFVFIFFGLLAVAGTYYVNALEWSMESVWLAIPVGALCVNILVVNNLRDIEQDKISGKRTLGVIFGETALKYEYAFLLSLSFTTPVFLFLNYSYSLIILLPLLSLPMALVLLNQIFHHQDKRILNGTLEKTAKFMVLFGVLLSIGVIFST